MNITSQRAKTRKEAKNKLQNILQNKPRTIIIHYSCESFYDRKDGSSPRITSIAVRNLDNAQTVSFSIHQQAEITKTPPENIELNYNKLEKLMLDEFYSYVREHNGYNWLHWNMRDINYGFPAIAHRYKVLEGTPGQIHDSQLIDLARLLVDLFGVAYSNHPRLDSIIELNSISKLAFLSGNDEAKAFEAKEYIKLHQSTLRKVDIFDGIIDRLGNDSLKHNAKLLEIHGGIIGVINEFLKEHPVITAIGFIGTILGIFSALKII